MPDTKHILTPVEFGRLIDEMLREAQRFVDPRTGEAEIRGLRVSTMRTAADNAYRSAWHKAQS